MVPYKARPYFAPSAKAGKFDESAYSLEMHNENLAVMRRTLEVHGSNDETPWLSTGMGVAAVKNTGARFDFSSVYLADDGMSYRQGLHFVRQDVTVHEDKGLRARTRVYPTLGRVVQLFTTSDAAWSMMYPTLNRHPKEASGHVQKWLLAPHDLAPASPGALDEIFPERHFALKHWVGVKPVK